jgi:hypothetical protein
MAHAALVEAAGVSALVLQEVLVLCTPQKSSVLTLLALLVQKYKY